MSNHKNKNHKKMKIKTRPNPPLFPEMSHEMKKLVEEAYQWFIRPLGSHLTDVCTDCCVSKQDEALLIKTPVQELSEDLIYQYLDAAYTDCRSNEIAHFLPRILELLASHKHIRHSTEITLDKCHFEAPYWKPQQLDFIHRYSAQYLTDLLKTPPKQTHLPSATEVIVMFSLSGIDVTHLFSVWEEMATKYPTAVAHFAQMMRYEVDDYSTFNNVFCDNPKFYQQINDWLNSSQTAAIFLPAIEHYYFENEDLSEEESRHFSCLHSHLSKKVGK